MKEEKGDDMSVAIIEGKTIEKEKDVYVQVASQIDFGVGYGYNYHAFLDRLGYDLERPIHIVWKDHAVSKDVLGRDFDRLVALMEQIKRDDERFCPEGERFTFSLE